MLIKYGLPAVAVVLAAAVGIPRYEAYQHHKEGEAKYAAAVAAYTQAVNAATEERAIAEAQLRAKYDAEVSSAGHARAIVFEDLRANYPGVLPADSKAEDK